MDLRATFVPTSTMPGPVRAFAEYQPVTSIVNAIRDLLIPRAVLCLVSSLEFHGIGDSRPTFSVTRRHRYATIEP